MKMKKLPSEANSEKGDLSGEGRLRENRELMDKNRIEGRHGAMSWHNTAKSAGMPVEVNAEAVRWSNVQLPGEIPPLQGGGKSAEAIVIAETSRSAHEPTDNARRRGELESRDGGKHGAPQERTMIEEILELENLSAAWKRVKRNKGAPGIAGPRPSDGRGLSSLRDDLRDGFAMNECAPRRAVRSPTGPSAR